MAKPRTRSPQVVRRQFGNSYLVRKLLHQMPNGLLRKPFFPDSARPMDAPEQSSSADTGGTEPILQQFSYSVGHWDCADMTGLTDQIHDRQVFFSLLEVTERQLGDFVSS